MRPGRRRIYLDACCYCRLFDSPIPARNHLEAESVLAILDTVQRGTWDLVASEVLERELAAGPDRDRREVLLGLLAAAGHRVVVGQPEYNRSSELVRLGAHRVDALHVACAETGGCDVLLTTDDRLLRIGKRHAGRLRLAVRNPLEWLMEHTK